MKKFTVKIQREFEVGIEAVDLQTAEALARQVLLQFPPGTAKLLSLVAEDAKDESCAACKEEGPIKPDPTPSPYRPKPVGGGSPATPTIRVPVLVDQIAEAA